MMDTSERIFYIVETQQEIYPFLLGLNVTVVNDRNQKRKSIAVDQLKVADIILSRSGKEEEVTAIRVAIGAAKCIEKQSHFKLSGINLENNLPSVRLRQLGNQPKLCILVSGICLGTSYLDNCLP